MNGRTGRSRFPRGRDVRLERARGTRLVDLTLCRRLAELLPLPHPGIVRVLERHAIDDGWHYFVMEFIDGEDLDRAVRGAERGLAIILDVAEALQFAHERKLVHRDGTPSNILLDRAGRPHLTDFDLVRAADTTGGTRVVVRPSSSVVSLARPRRLDIRGASARRHRATRLPGESGGACMIREGLP